MKKLCFWILMLMFVGGGTKLSFAAEHGGTTVPTTKEHGGTTAPAPAAKEHGGSAAPATAETKPATATTAGTEAKTPSADDIRNAMKSYVESNLQDGTFNVPDEETGKPRKLRLIRVHERVGKTGSYYYSCADFKDTESDDLLDLDLDVEDQSGTLKVVDVRIHKVNGKERYTYDENDNRIPVADTTEDMGDTDKGSMMKEHGSKEHGGR